MFQAFDAESLTDAEQGRLRLAHAVIIITTVKDSDEVKKDALETWRLPVLIAKRALNVAKVFLSTATRQLYANGTAPLHLFRSIGVRRILCQDDGVETL